MSPEVFIALVGFSIVSSITPGPNNLMLLASGVNFGFRRTIPHMFGISLGFLSLLLGIGFGLGQVLQTAPVIYTSLKFAGGAYLVYLAYKIAISGPIETTKEKSRPMSFLAAAAFQWVNPKAWVMAVSSMAVYTDLTQYTLSVLQVAAVFSLAGMPFICVWTLFGTALRTFLSNPIHLRRFNVTMALLLIASLWPMLR